MVEVLASRHTYNTFTLAFSMNLESFPASVEDGVDKNCITLITVFSYLSLIEADAR